ncbi:MAG: MinD/ParA family protein [Cyanobacteria bacterium P01_A01_bin.135]
MAKTISVHSYRGGTGKSNTTANLATTLASQGNRVGLLDADIQSPGIHTLFQLDVEQVPLTLNNYLWGNCDITEATYDVTPAAVQPSGGKIFLVPSSIRAGDITKVLKEGYDIRLLKRGLKSLTKEYNLDYLLIDTHPGINEETLLAIAISNVLLLILRPDAQDFQGSAVVIDLARKLYVSKIFLVINRVLEALDAGAIQSQVESIYNAPVAGVFFNCDEMMQVASKDLFCLQYPNHALTRAFQAVAQQLTD